MNVKCNKSKEYMDTGNTDNYMLLLPYKEISDNMRF